MNNFKRFDYNEFESLSGFELGQFCTLKKNQVGIDENFLKYFKEKSLEMDDLHLEMAIFLLGKYKTKNSIYEILKYIDYSYRPVRFVAISIIQSLDDYEFDSHVFEKAKDVILKNPDMHDYIELKQRINL